MSATRVGSIVVLALAAVGAVLGAIEVAVRLWPMPVSDLRGMHELRPDRPWLFGMRPHARQPIAGMDDEYRINADGFRGAPVDRPKPSGTFRVVLLGDSLVFGWSVAEQDTLAQRTQRTLQAWSPGPRVEVLNLGVSGYNPYTEARLLEEVGPVYRPDLVLAQFCVNDLNDPTLHFDYATRTPLALPDAAFPDPARRRSPPSLAERLCAHSRACALLRSRFSTKDDQVRALEAIAPHGDPSASELAWLGERYGEMARTAGALGARFAVVVFPYSVQLEADAPATLQAALRRLGDERGWPTIDLLPAYRQARMRASNAELFIDLWHPTARGYGVAGEALARALACAGLVPVTPPPGTCDAAAAARG